MTAARLRVLLPVALVVALFSASIIAVVRGKPEQQAPPLEARLAIIDDENNLLTVRADGSDRRRIVALQASKSASPLSFADTRAYRWPTWAPDGARLAFMTIDVDAGGQSAVGAVHVADLVGGPVHQVWASRRGGPIYLNWHPQGRQLTLLALNDEKLHLLAAVPESNRPWYPLATGQTLYVGWSPDGRTAAVHVSGDRRVNADAHLLLANWAARSETPQMARLDLEPNGFRAPAWSADGRWLALGVHQAEGPTLVLRGRDGSTRALASTGPEPAFVWSPTAPRLAVSDAVPGFPNVYDGLAVYDVERGVRREIAREQLVAFFWSPDGQQIAYMALDFPGRALAWHVVGADGRDHRVVARLLPTQEQFQAFAFFDQYAQSNAVWSPDSQSLVGAGWNADEGLPTPGQPSAIYVIPTAYGAGVQRIGAGTQAFWSPLDVAAWRP